jgi:hypothetical protein
VYFSCCDTAGMGNRYRNGWLDGLAGISKHMHSPYMELGWVRRKRARSFVGVYGVVRYFCCWSTRGGSAWNSYDTSRCLISIMTPSRGWGRTYVFGSVASSYVWYLCTSGMYYDGDLGMKMGVLLPLNAVRVLIFWWFPGLQTRCSVGGVWGFQWVVSDISQRQNFTQYLKSGRERSRFAVPDEFHLKKGVEPSSPSSVIIISRSVHNQQTPKSLHSTYISTPSRAAFFKKHSTSTLKPRNSLTRYTPTEVQYGRSSFLQEMAPRFDSPSPAPETTAPPNMDLDSDSDSIFSRPRPRPPRSPEHEARIRIQNRRRAWLERNPWYFENAEHELAGRFTALTFLLFFLFFSFLFPC